MHKLQLLKQMIENNNDVDSLIKECIEEFSESKQNKRGLITLILRNYINKDKIDEVKNILYNNNDLMRRDYLACLEYFLKKNKDYYYFDIEYIYNNIGNYSL
jgi:hypothetical protein